MTSSIATAKHTRTRARRTFSLHLARLLEPLEPRQLLSAVLSATFVSSPETVVNGALAEVTLNVQNTGDARSLRSSNVQIFAGPANEAFNADTATFLASARRFGTVAAGANRNITFDVPVSSALAAGDYDLFAVTNNATTVNDTTGTTTGTTTLSGSVTDSTGITLTQRDIDLVPGVTGGTVPVLTPGNSARGRVRISVSNEGTDSINGFAVINVSVVARPTSASDSSQDVVLTADNAGINVSNLAANGHRTLSFATFFPDTLAAGNYNLIVTVDTTHNVAETDETNNQLTLSTLVNVGTPSGAGQNGGGGTTNLRNLRTVSGTTGNTHINGIKLNATIDNSIFGNNTGNNNGSTGGNTNGSGSSNGNNNGGGSGSGNGSGTTNGVTIITRQGTFANVNVEGITSGITLTTNRGTSTTNGATVSTGSGTVANINPSGTNNGSTAVTPFATTFASTATPLTTDLAGTTSSLKALPSTTLVPTPTLSNASSLASTSFPSLTNTSAPLI